MSSAAAETETAVGAVNPETQAEVAETVKPQTMRPGKPVKKKKSWRARKREIEAQKAADAAPAPARISSVLQAAKLQATGAEKKVAKKKAKKTRAGKHRKSRGPVPAELAGLHARKKAIEEQLAGINNAIGVAAAALRAAKS